MFLTVGHSVSLFNYNKIRGAHKPNSVYTAINLVCMLPYTSLRPTRNLKRAALIAVAYLALHRMGFALPLVLLPMR